MKKIFFSFIIFGLCLIPVHSQGIMPEAEKHIEKLESKETHLITLPEIKKGKIKNGLKYYILPEHELPITKAVILIRGGTVYDPIGKSGLMDFTAELMRMGGTEFLKPDEVDSRLDSIASTVDIAANRENIAAMITCRAEHFEESLNILFDMLFRPGFDKIRYEIIKARYLNSVKRRPDSPDLLAITGFRSLLYGNENPWGQYATTKSVNSISLKDIKKTHEKFFRPDNLIVGISGDIKPSKAVDLIKSYKYYPSKTVAELTSPEARPTPKSGIHIIDKDSTQVVFNVGHEGSYRFNPDKYALIVMNDILGGGGSFRRRLPALIRVEKGLAYTVYSHYGFGPDNAHGMFNIYLATKNQSAVHALELVKSELIKFSDQAEISETELSNSKAAILKRLIFEYNSAFNIIVNVVRFNYFGYPDNYIEEYGREISKVTLGDVKRVAREYLHPDKLQVVLVGNEKELVNNFKDKFKTSKLTIEN